MAGTITDQLERIRRSSETIATNTSIEYGAGATTAKTQRVAIASDANSVVFASPQAVTGTFWQTTQPVSIASLPVLAAGTNAIGSITNTSFGISGTLPAFASTPTINIGTAPNLTITNTAFTANAGTNLNTSALAITANQIPAFTNSPLNFGAVNQFVLKASAGAVYKAYCHNKSTSTRFFQLHNKATAPINGDAPVESFPVAPSTAVMIDSAFWGATGRVCSAGVSWAFSSTESTLTLATASDQSSSVGYL